MKNNRIFISIVIAATALILGGLFIYSKGQVKDLESKKIALSPNVDLNFEKVYSKPKDTANFYVIFYVKASNKSNQREDLRETATYSNSYNSNAPTIVNPCIQYNNNYNYNSDNRNTYDSCLQSQAYQDYLTQLKNQSANKILQEQQSKIELMTPQNQLCSYNSSYQITSRYPNLGSNQLTYGTLSSFEPNESKVGSLVYECAQNKGNFTVKYQSSSIQIDI